MVVKRAAIRQKQAGPRTKIGKGTRRECQVNDLVHVVDPRDSGQEFTARVAGGYTLAGAWHLQLAAPPSGPRGEHVQLIPRISTPLKNVKTVYRRQK